MLGEQDVGASIRLTWGENPAGFGQSSVRASRKRRHLSCLLSGIRTEAVVDTVITLDVDDTDFLRPRDHHGDGFSLAWEPTSISFTTIAGNSTISASPARVELNLGAETHIFSPEMASGFDIGHKAPGGQCSGSRWMRISYLEVIPVQSFDECRADSCRLLRHCGRR